MNFAFLKTTLVPILAVGLCCLLYLFDSFLGITAAIIILIASAVEFKRDAFTSLGFYRKGLNLKNLFLWAPLVSGGLFLLFYFLLVPGATYLTGQALDHSDFDGYQGNLPATLTLLGFIWISAAFGEEIVFRGYLMRQFVKFFGESHISILINIVLFGILFGWVHAYQGITGQLVTGVLGVLFSLMFYLRKYDLWFNVAVHGFFDTIALVFVYYGWY